MRNRNSSFCFVCNLEQHKDETEYECHDPGDDALPHGNAHGSALVPTLDAWGWFVLAVIAVVGTFAAYFLFLNGISMVGSVQGSQLGAIEPVSATVCSAVLTGTVFSAYDWVGLVLMVCTILLVARGGADTTQSDVT